MHMNLAERVVAAFEANPGATSAELAAIVGTRHEYVRTALQRAGKVLARSHSLRAPKPPRTTPIRKYHRLQEWETQAILDGLKAGEKQDALAAEFGVDISTVCNIGRRNGLSRVRPKERQLTKYRTIGFFPDLEVKITEYATKKKVGFGEAARLLIERGFGHALND